ncbi:MAG TPA: M67 family metallopeptidase [Coleofasciculaceae cyanobacterium]
MVLTLPRPLLDRLCQAAESALPHECCGLLLGQAIAAADPADGAHPTPTSAPTIAVHDLWPATNDWEHLADDPIRALDSIPASETSPERRYAIAPATMLAAMRASRARNLDIIGVYHSHPQHSAVPSEFDRACAWPDYSYLILSVKGDRTVDWQSWRLNPDRQFYPEAIVLL